MTRIPPLDESDLSDEQRGVYDAISAGPRGSVRGPLAVWLQSPELAQRAQELGAFCRFDSSLPPRLSELAILVTARFWRSGYEWHAHEPFARRGGLDEAAIEAIRRGETPTLANADEAVVYRFATELLHDHAVSAATWEQAQQLLGMRSVVDLVGILGYYGLISMTINAFEIPIPADAPNPFDA